MDDVMDKESFRVGDVYAILEKFRIKNDYTVAEMARKMGWPYQQYSNMKNRLDKRMKRSTIVKASKALNIDFAGLSALAKQQEVLDTYAPEIIIWMATAEGRKIVTSAFVNYKKSIVLANLREEVEDVVSTTYNMNKKDPLK